MKTVYHFILVAFSSALYLLSLSSCLQTGPVTVSESSDTSETVSVAVKTTETASNPNVVYGKYGCTVSKYRNGSYEYIPRGFFVLAKNGKYTYNGFEKPSVGTFTVDEKGDLHFKGGYFDGGKAEKIDRPNKYFLVFPSNPDNRWTCSLIKE